MGSRADAFIPPLAVLAGGALKGSWGWRAIESCEAKRMWERKGTTLGRGGEKLSPSHGTAMVNGTTPRSPEKKRGIPGAHSTRRIAKGVEENAQPLQTDRNRHHCQLSQLRI